MLVRLSNAGVTEEVYDEVHGLWAEPRLGAYFGAPLPSMGVPRILVECAAFLELHALQTEGLFRVGADESQRSNLRRLYDNRETEDPLRIALTAAAREIFVLAKDSRAAGGGAADAADVAAPDVSAAGRGVRSSTSDSSVLALEQRTSIHHVVANVLKSFIKHVPGGVIPDHLYHYCSQAGHSVKVCSVTPLSVGTHLRLHTYHGQHTAVPSFIGYQPAMWNTASRIALG